MKIYSTFIHLDDTPQRVQECDGPVCVVPSLMDYAGDDSAAFAGFPTGQHHHLVKATEARLAVSQGASVVIAVANPQYSMEESPALITELVTLREAVPHPTTLAVVFAHPRIDVAKLHRLALTAKTCGVDAIGTAIDESNPAADASISDVLPVVSIGAKRPEVATLWLRTPPSD